MPDNNEETKGYERDIDAETLAIWNRFHDKVEQLHITTSTKIQAVRDEVKAFKQEQKQNWLEFAKSWKGVNQITSALEKITGKK